MADGTSGIMPRMSSAAPTDEVLVARYAAGDVGAFEALYQRHEQPLWRFLLRLCRDRAAAEELMQETWFAVTREAPRFRIEARFTPWLYAIARHRVIDRHRATRATESLDAVHAEGDEPLVARLADERSPSPPVVTERMDQGRAILAALVQLPLEQREAFLLQVEGGLSVEEIAQATGTTFETAKSRLRYARDKLKALLRDHAP
jgi:RNA polymerase sigma factor (sigma-70 family)